jgi:hypothetical protein
MTFIAHWPLDDGSGDGPTTARDAAAGGSGSHAGTYNLLNQLGYGRLLPGGVGGKHLYARNSHTSGTVTAIGNPADLRLLGTMTLCVWVSPDFYYYYQDGVPIVGCTGTDDTAAQNDLWALEFATSRAIRFGWENGTGVDVDLVSSSNLLNQQGWTHVGVERYEVVAGKWGANFYADGQFYSTDDNGGLGYDPPDGGGSSIPLLGRNAAGQPSYPYSFDSVRVYDTVIGAAAIEAVYDAEVVGFDDMPTKDDWALENMITVVPFTGDTFDAVESGPYAGRVDSGFVLP